MISHKFRPTDRAPTRKPDIILPAVSFLQLLWSFRRKKTRRSKRTLKTYRHFIFKRYFRNRQSSAHNFRSQISRCVRHIGKHDVKTEFFGENHRHRPCPRIDACKCRINLTFYFLDGFYFRSKYSLFLTMFVLFFYNAKIVNM